MSAGDSAGSGKRNVVVLYMDDQGYHAGFLGTPGLKTPNLDRLAGEGVVFTRALAASSVCSPSRGALLTGMLPHSNGLFRLVENSGLDFPKIAVKPDKLPPMPVGIREEVPTLIEILRDKGYFTAITQKTHVQPIWRFPFSKGYNYHNKPGEFAELVDQVLADAGGRPFFLEANISPPHLPFDVHLKANNLLDAQGRVIGMDPSAMEMFPWLPDTPVMRADLAKYYACIQIADACAGAVLEGLRRNGLSGNTLVVYSSDNGMGYHRAKVSAYPAGLRMPFVISGPGVEGGRTITAPVSQIDVMPTILQYLNLPVPPNVQGRSLWPILSGKESAFPDRKTVMGSISQQFIGRCVVDDRYYYVRNVTQPRGTWEKPPLNEDLFAKAKWGNVSFQETIDAKDRFPGPYRLLADYVNGNLPSEELYDLEKDPWGMHNLANDPEHAEKLRELRAEMDGWRSRTGDSDDPKAFRIPPFSGN